MLSRFYKWTIDKNGETIKVSIGDPNSVMGMFNERKAYDRFYYGNQALNNEFDIVNAIKHHYGERNLKVAEEPEWEMAVGDINSQEKGSGARANGGKPRLDLVPDHLLIPVANVFEHGAEKYDDWNWAKGMAWSIPLGCMRRHLAAFAAGEDIDGGPNGSGESHMAHIICNAMMILHYQHFYREGDDRPSEWFLEALPEYFKNETD